MARLASGPETHPPSLLLLGIAAHHPLSTLARMPPSIAAERPAVPLAQLERARQDLEVQEGAALSLCPGPQVVRGWRDHRLPGGESRPCLSVGSRSFQNTV